MKKYFVSLCVKIPANFELEVKAKSGKEAFEKAYSMFDRYEVEKITEPFWNEAELDIDTKTELSKPGNGIYIEER